MLVKDTISPRLKQFLNKLGLEHKEKGSSIRFELDIKVKGNKDIEDIKYFLCESFDTEYHYLTEYVIMSNDVDTRATFKSPLFTTYEDEELLLGLDKFYTFISSIDNKFINMFDKKSRKDRWVVNFDSPKNMLDLELLKLEIAIKITKPEVDFLM